MQVMLMCCIEESRWLALPAAERDAVMSDYGAWVADLERAGQHRATEKLAGSPRGEDAAAAGRQGASSRTGRSPRRRSSSAASTSSSAATSTRRSTIAARIPTLRVGGTIEVRPGGAAQLTGVDADAGPRTRRGGLARGIAARARDADPAARRLRPRGGGAARGVRGGHRAVAARRRAGEPARLARLGGALQGDRRACAAARASTRRYETSRSARGRRCADPASAADDDGSRTTGCASSSPAAIRRSRRTRRSR